MVSEALSELIQPFILHAEKYKFNERAFAEDLKEHLGMLKYALRQILVGGPRSIVVKSPFQNRLIGFCGV